MIPQLNTKKLEDYRKNLRINQTDAEYKLWYCLRNKRLLNLKFYRQYSVDRYILDFYCPKLKLAIELDGGQHLEQVAYDTNRTKHLQQYGIVVLRFFDNDIFRNLDDVLQVIYNKIMELF